eukprot:scaffold4747_cov99-Isochrysis_galbana.AAC.2
MGMHARQRGLCRSAEHRGLEAARVRAPPDRCSTATEGRHQGARVWPGPRSASVSLRLKPRTDELVDGDLVDNLGAVILLERLESGLLLGHQRDELVLERGGRQATHMPSPHKRRLRHKGPHHRGRRFAPRGC